MDRTQLELLEASVTHTPAPHPIRHSATPRTPAPRPLVVTADDGILDDVLRLAAAAGVEVNVAHDPGAARSSWASVPMVVIGADQADGLAHLAPTRRRDVYLIGQDRDDPTIWRRGVVLGAEQVLFFPADESWLADRFADAAEGERGDALVVGVVGGRGGAGASVLATALGITASRRNLSAMLIDLDPFGGGLDLVLGAEEVTGLRWPDLADSRGRLSARALRAELPARHGLTVLSWDRGDVLGVSPESVQVVLAAARRACDLVVLDLPRAFDPTFDGSVSACTVILMLVPTEVRAVAAASRIAARLAALASDVRLVSRGTSPGVTGDGIADALGLELVAHMPDERRLDGQLDRGDTPGLHERGHLATTSDRILDALLFERQVAG
ncbi:septum site-determining protein Ssd [Phytoactinopolyspora halophila]|uniref:septum site-determining protein Ssd n=1 Tax=Phytoactinopolyspora halophila TaxID=1981511 RepID=UPI0013148CB6|nr:septum site-determining protein Ssd [Phytoactinopolyspora halophila]